MRIIYHPSQYYTDPSAILYGQEQIVIRRTNPVEGLALCIKHPYDARPELEHLKHREEEMVMVNGDGKW